jgi:hypothetical protein
MNSMQDLNSLIDSIQDIEQFTEQLLDDSHESIDDRESINNRKPKRIQSLQAATAVANKRLSDIKSRELVEEKMKKYCLLHESNHHRIPSVAPVHFSNFNEETLAQIEAVLQAHVMACIYKNLLQQLQQNDHYSILELLEPNYSLVAEQVNSLKIQLSFIAKNKKHPLYKSLSQDTIDQIQSFPLLTAKKVEAIWDRITQQQQLIDQHKNSNSSLPLTAQQLLIQSQQLLAIEEQHIKKFTQSFPRRDKTSW